MPASASTKTSFSSSERNDSPARKPYERAWTLGIAALALSAAAAVQAATDLGITVETNNAAPVVGGAAFEYTIVVTNHGPDAAENVVVVDPLPSGIVMANPNIGVEVDPPDSGFGFVCTGPAVGENGTVICRGNMPAPGLVDPTAEITIIARVSSDVSSGVRSNRATVISDTQEDGSEPNTDEAMTNQTVNATLSITKTGPTTLVPGTNVVYRIVVFNTGPSTAINANISDPLPAGSSFLGLFGTGAFHDGCTHNGGSPGIVSCSDVNIPPGDHSLTLVLKTDPGIPPGDFTNIATITSTGTGSIGQGSSQTTATIEP